MSLDVRKRSSGFPTRSHTNQAVQPHNISRDLKFIFRKLKDCTIRLAKPKALISCTVTAQPICVFFTDMQKADFLIRRLK